MIDSTTLELDTEIKRRHGRLREMAIEQDVKSVTVIKDLYVQNENFDVDDFLAIVREMRQSDRVKIDE